MNVVDVKASRHYQVHIGSGILAQLGSKVTELCHPGKAVIVSDSNVYPLYGETAAASLKAAGLQVASFIFPAGESSKCGTVYLELLNYLADNRITRSDCLVALGGGVTGDLTGFAAATYLRGIPFIQVPTTLLAAVDSSVGGKTAIDLPSGKNLVGAFYQPHLVLCDVDTLNTLPEEIFRDGCAEVIKYGILYDEALFCHLEDCGIHFRAEEVIARCVELKRDVVMEDEFDTGARMKLNLGHTIGHGVEAQSGYEISHGKAVAIGTAIVSRAAYASGKCSEITRNRIVDVLKLFGLPTATTFSAQELFTSALSDKKRSGDTVNLIVPSTVGNCEIVPTPVDALKSFIEAGL